jgi:hypothetical protein
LQDAVTRLIVHVSAVQEPFRDFYNVLKVEGIMDSIIETYKSKVGYRALAIYDPSSSCMTGRP